MKTNLGHSMFFFLCASFGMLAQENGLDPKLDFYLQLAFRDAQYEQTLHELGSEDQADYWKDQLIFEKELLNKNPGFHQAYINGKHIAYGQHQKHCDTDCNHSDAYFIQASYYAAKGTFKVSPNSALSSEDTKRIKVFKIQNR